MLITKRQRRCLGTFLFQTVSCISLYQYLNMCGMLMHHCYLFLHLFRIICIKKRYDDVTKWKHFSRYWPFVRGIHRSPVNFPHKGQWRGALMFSLICTLINNWVSNREAGDLRRYRAHYDVIVMTGSIDILEMEISSLFELNHSFMFGTCPERTYPKIYWKVNRIIHLQEWVRLNTSVVDGNNVLC